MLLESVLAATTSVPPGSRSLYKPKQRRSPSGAVASPLASPVRFGPDWDGNHAWCMLEMAGWHADCRVRDGRGVLACVTHAACPLGPPWQRLDGFLAPYDQHDGDSDSARRLAATRVAAERVPVAPALTSARSPVSRAARRNLASMAEAAQTESGRARRAAPPPARHDRRELEPYAASWAASRTGSSSRCTR